MQWAEDQKVFTLVYFSGVSSVRCEKKGARFLIFSVFGIRPPDSGLYISSFHFVYFFLLSNLCRVFFLSRLPLSRSFLQFRCGVCYF